MKQKYHVLVLLGFLLGLGLPLLSMMGWAGGTAVHAAGILYVDDDSACASNCGGSWANAFPTLQDALATAVSGDQIWVAAGIYYPDEGGGQTDNDCSASFVLQDGVAVYGGFAGTETQRSQRDPGTNVTVLSGGNTNYHVVTADAGVGSSAVLDGFTVSGGNANGVYPENRGGGLAISGGAVRSQVKEAGFQYRAAQERLERSARETERAVRDSFLSVNAEISRVQALAKSVESNQTALRATEAGFEVGTRTTVDVLDARRNVFEAQRDYARSRYTYVVNALRLKQAAGTLGEDDIREVDGWLAGE